MSKIGLFLFTLMLTPMIALADPPGGHGHGNAGFVGGGRPPGLEGKSPPGLAKKVNAPYGWSRGEKEGWEGEHYHHHHYYYRDEDEGNRILDFWNY